jgi:hypothetical protein
VCENSYPFIFFFDTVCQLEFDANFVYVAMITAAYFTYDFIFQKYWVAYTEDATAKQTLYHHIIGITGIFFGIGSGY